MIEVAIEEMHGSDRVPDLNIDCERGIGWIRHTFNESEMALFFERVLLCAQKVLDTADIVIALGKAWKRGNRDETVKLLDGIQRV
jgi:hypothetical protein